MTSTIDHSTELTALDPSAPHRQAIWLLNSLMVERATTQDTGGAYTMFEQWLTADGNPPPHMHEHEDEAFLVLEGSIDVTVGGETVHVPAGGYAFGPRGVAHTYAVPSNVARLLIISTPGGAEHFFRQLGEPAKALALPVPVAPDVPRVVSVAA